MPLPGTRKQTQSPGRDGAAFRRVGHAQHAAPDDELEQLFGGRGAVADDGASQ